MNEPKSHAVQAEFWKVHIDRWMDKACRLTQSEYCLQQDLSESAFSKWKHRLYPKLRRSKTPTKTAIKWEDTIKYWDGKKETQAYYCYIQQISEASFSKWKNKLHPKSKRKQIPYRQNSDYFEFSHLSDDTIEILIHGFLDQTPAHILASRADISLKSCYKYLYRIKVIFIASAINYPALYNGAGFLLFLGPPPHIHKYLLETYKNKGTRPSKRKYLNCLTDSILYHSCFDWSNDEIWFFYVYGWLFLFARVYKKKHGMDGEYYSEFHQNCMRAEYSETDVVEALWTDYISTGFIEILSEEAWMATYHTHKFDPTKKNNKAIFQDLKWGLKNYHPLKRNPYWDEFKANANSVQKVEHRIDESFQELYGE